MPGICGIVSQVTPVDFSTQLADMLSRMKHYPWYVENRHTDSAAGIGLGRVALGFTDSAAQPAANADASRCVVMAGEIYDYEEQRRALEAEGYTFGGRSQAELLLHGFEFKGMEFFSQLHGSFAAAIWDSPKRQLVLVNDRFGLKPLYYAQGPGRFLIASEIMPLLVDPQVPRHLNLRAVAQFFTYGQMLGDDTLLETVQLLPAAGWLTYDAREDRVRLDNYWRPQTRLLPPSTSRAEALDRLDEAFKIAVERQTAGPGQLGLSLSGGLDSRTILAAMGERGAMITAVSVGVEGSIDHRAAKHLAAIAGCRYHACFLDTQFLSQFEKHMRRMVHLTDGHYLSQCIVMPTLPVYRELGIEVLLRGHAGELLHMEKAYSFSLDRQAWAIHDEVTLEEWLFRHLQTYMLDRVSGPLFAPPYQAHVEGLARDSLRSCLRESAAIEPPLQRIWHLFLSQRLRRETTLSMRKFGSLVETRLPYLDNELIDLLLSIPPEWKIGDTIQRHIIKRGLPAFLDVVNANTGAPMGASRFRRWLGKARLKVLAKLGVQGYQPYERLGLWLREELQPFVRQVLLDARCLDRGLWNPDTIKSVVDQHMSSRGNHTFLLLALMIFELGQARLTGEQGVSPPILPAVPA